MTGTSRITAIETRYAGCRFRSRLEARWAVFFDHLGIRWEYEPQGYVIDGRPYLPDFWIPELHTWVEVKGDPHGVDWPLWNRFIEGRQGESSEAESMLLLGPLPPPADEGDWVWCRTYDHVTFGSMPQERRFWVDPYIEKLGGKRCPPTGVTPGYTCDTNSYGAYQAARSARFEHGECG
jgi:hypothetical protein